MKALPKTVDTKYLVDTKDMVEWLEGMGSFALSDLLKSLEKGNLEAAQAHAERIRMLEYVAPWIGANKAYLGICMRYEQNESE